MGNAEIEHGHPPEQRCQGVGLLLLCERFGCSHATALDYDSAHSQSKAIDARLKQAQDTM